MQETDPSTGIGVGARARTQIDTATNPYAWCGGQHSVFQCPDPQVERPSAGLGKTTGTNVIGVQLQRRLDVEAVDWNRIGRAQMLYQPYAFVTHEDSTDHGRCDSLVPG